MFLGLPAPLFTVDLETPLGRQVGRRAFQRFFDSLEPAFGLQKGAELARTAVRAADTLDRVLFERFGDIQIFANDRALVEGTPDEQSEKLREYKKLYWYYTWIGITDATGRIVVATDLFADSDRGGMTKDSAEGGLGVKQPDWFTKATSRGQVYLMEAQLSPETKGLMTVGFSAPIYGPQGDLRGVVTSRVSLENLRTILEKEEKLQDGEEAKDWLLLDRQGVVIIEKSRAGGLSGTLSKLDLPSWT